MKLEVLPAKLTEKEVKQIMLGWARALDVKCNHCHELSDFSADTEHKLVARKMARMVNDVNQKHLAKYKVQVSCVTCHRGKDHPPTLGGGTEAPKSNEP